MNISVDTSEVRLTFDNVTVIVNPNANIIEILPNGRVCTVIHPRVIWPWTSRRMVLKINPIFNG